MIATPRDREPFAGATRAIVVALVVAACGLALCVLGWVVDPAGTAASYLAAYMFAISSLLGLAGFVMASHLMRAGWPVTVRRLAELALAALPFLALAAIPLFFTLDAVYPWADPARFEERHVRELLEHRRPVMNAAFTIARLAVYLALWSGAAIALRRLSLAMDRPGAPDRRPALRRASGALLPLVGLTGAFAAFDWLMSLQTEFYSTMYGLYVLAGGFVGAMGLLCVMAWLAQRRGYLGAVGRSHWYALGRVLFAFLVFWAYTGFFQYLLIWLANKPVEAQFYVDRIRPGEEWTSWFLVFGHFAVPWLALLPYETKRRGGSVALLGAWIFLSHYVDVHWLVGPIGSVAATSWRWQDAPALAFIGGLAVAAALWRQRGRLLVPLHDPDYERGAAYESH